MGYKYIVNVVGSTKDEASEYGNYETWIEYWSELKGVTSDKFTICPNCLNIINDNNKIVGAHVYICTKNYEKNYTAHVKKIFIAPICNSCNLTKKGYNADIGGSQKGNVMQIDEKYLVLKPRHAKKKDN